MSGSHLKLRGDWLFGWKRSNCCPLFPFMGTYKHYSSVFCPPGFRKTEDWLSDDVLVWTVNFSCIQRPVNTHVCLALAEQYFLFLSASLSWPFLQHWPQTNIIFRFGGPNLLCALESCWWDLKNGLKSPSSTQIWHGNSETTTRDLANISPNQRAYALHSVMLQKEVSHWWHMQHLSP